MQFPLPFAVRGSGPRSNTMFLGPPRFFTPNSTSIRSAVLAHRSHTSDKLTDRNIAGNRLHLMHSTQPINGTLSGSLLSTQTSHFGRCGNRIRNVALTLTLSLTLALATGLLLRAKTLPLRHFGFSFPAASRLLPTGRL